MHAHYKLVALAVLIMLPFATQTSASQSSKQIDQIEHEALYLWPTDNPDFASLASSYSPGLQQNTSLEQTLGLRLLNQIYHSDFYQHVDPTSKTYSYLFFITYDVGSTANLGAGERAGVLSSWKKAYSRNSPETMYDWRDILKIANGRWPAARHADHEADSEKLFEEFYLRQPDRSNPHDDAAIMLMTYGIRPTQRNLASEVKAKEIFQNITHTIPTSADEWDIIRAIAYSGATR